MLIIKSTDFIYGLYNKRGIKMEINKRMHK